MKFISTKLHEVLDYLSGILLITLPWIFNFDNGGVAKQVPIILGIMIIIISLFTNYHMRIVKIIPMPMHLSIDVIIGIFLATSPWVFNFKNQVYLPHLIMGIFAICIGLFTQYQRQFFRQVH